MLTIPSRPTCSICNREIPAGTGLFVASCVGPSPEPGLTFVHSGKCATRAGAVEGGAVIFGEIRELVSVLWQGSSTVACHGGPVFIKARGTDGWAAVELLGWVTTVLAVVVAGMAVLRVAVVAGWFR